ncbi:MAG TPA: hypothetical protein ENK44_14090 [Caldithrix abyssi]|uniref:histidine kinase n=1 Tax=Caldithrix abyssi TaxID=187145 RepID=A0A7V4U361_CALAY|nr:hypothetical protein [Caldithrix abyssi]
MQKPLKKIYLTLAGLSLVASLAITVWLWMTMYPFHLVEVSKAVNVLNGRIDFYKDLNNDGLSERLIFFSNRTQKSYNIKIYNQFSLNRAKIIDQYNFKNFIDFHEIFFQDITGDGSMEVFVFSKNDTCLYLSVIDIKENRYLYKERLLFHGPESNPHITWDVDIIDAVFSDINADGTVEMIFTLHSGHSQSPRGIFALDIKNWKIIRQFLYNAGTAQIFTCDINEDGIDEFVTSHAATDNIRSTENYTDQKSWLMAFDNNLNLLFKPVELGGRFTTCKAMPFRYHGQNMILTIAFTQPAMVISVIDKNGQVVVKKSFDSVPHIAIQSALLADGIKLIPTGNSGTLLTIDSLFNFKKQNIFSDGKVISLFDIKDLNEDGQFEYLGHRKDGIYIKSNDMNTLAFYPWNNKYVKSFCYFYPGINKRPYIHINTNDLGYMFRFQSNPFYPYIPLVFLVLSTFLYGLFYLFHVGINQIRIYASYLLFSLKGSDNAIILLNHNGKIISYNSKVQDMLKIPGIQAKQHYKQTLITRKPIIEIIEKVFKEGRQYKKEYSFEDVENSFVGNVTVTPFKSYFRFINAVLIEIKDSTQQVLFERQQNWQRNIRRMVHDIKNPLAGVQLKLQTLYIKLIDSQPNLPPDIKEEFELAYSELKRIRNISKNFLKISDLEIIQPEQVSLQSIYLSCSEHFKLYQTDALKLNFHLDQKLPIEVYWDRRQIELLLHIIVENAIDALNGKGTIEVQIRPSAEVLSTELPYIEFRISDDGPGIPKELHEKIFEPHFSTKKEGSGMGLVFAKQIVKQHGGSINFFSGKNSGTVFVITLPSRFISFNKNSNKKV